MIYTFDTENCMNTLVETTYDSPVIHVEFDIRRDHLVEGDLVWQLCNDIANMSYENREECFGYRHLANITHHFSYKEARKLYDKWKKEKEAICVFDEVTPLSNVRCLVTQKVGSVCNYITSDGACGRMDEAFLTKTGRRFTDLKEFMEDE